MDEIEATHRIRDISLYFLLDFNKSDKTGEKWIKPKKCMFYCAGKIFSCFLPALIIICSVLDFYDISSFSMKHQQRNIFSYTRIVKHYQSARQFLLSLDTRPKLHAGKISINKQILHNLQHQTLTLFAWLKLTKCRCHFSLIFFPINADVLII